jgi:hypothetical protein
MFFTSLNKKCYASSISKAAGEFKKIPVIPAKLVPYPIRELESRGGKREADSSLSLP